MGWISSIFHIGFATKNEKSRGIAKIGEARGLSGNRLKGRKKPTSP